MIVHHCHTYYVLCSCDICAGVVVVAAAVAAAAAAMQIIIYLDQLGIKLMS